MNRPRIRAGVMALTVAAVASLGILGLASPAQAAKTTQGAAAWNHVTSPKSVTGAFLSGWTVSMQCWRDGDWAYGTNRWFWVSGFGVRNDGSSGTISGFVSANLIANQAIVPRCSWT